MSSLTIVKSTNLDSAASPIGTSQAFSRTLTIPLEMEPPLVRAAFEHLDLAGPANEMLHALDAGDRLALAPTALPERDGGPSIGIIWRFDEYGSHEHPAPDGFSAFDAPNHLKARWDVRIESLAAAQTYLSIRTEFIPTDDDAERRLLGAWGIIEPLASAFAGRIARTIRSAAENWDEEL
jgi:hypothetical protein